MRFSVSTFGTCDGLRVGGFSDFELVFFRACRLVGGELLPEDVGDRWGEVDFLMLIGLDTDVVTMGG